MNLPDAQKSAKSIIETLAPLCLTDDKGVPLCRVAGSVRRLKPDFIKDIEIVAVPDIRRVHEFRDIVNSKWGIPSAGKYPSKYTKVRGAYDLDMFWCTRATFGLNFFIRTGPAEYVARALAAWKKKTNGGCSLESQLRWPDGRIEETPDEEFVFWALGWKFVPPEKRV